MAEIVGVVKQTDSIYEGVLTSKVCRKCRGKRPRRGGWTGRLRKVVVFQITPGGQFHLALPTVRRALCGQERRI